MAKAVEKLNLHTFGKRLIEVFKQNLGKDNKKRGSLWKTVFWSTQMGKSHPTKKNKIHLYLSTAISPKLHLFRFYLYEKERPSTILQRIFSPRKKARNFSLIPKSPSRTPSTDAEYLQPFFQLPSRGAAFYVTVLTRVTPPPHSQQCNKTWPQRQ